MRTSQNTVDRIRSIKSEQKLESTIESAIDRAITEILEDFVLRPFLIAHRSEVKGMLLTEYNEVETMQLFKEDGRREGRLEGRQEGALDAISTFLKNGGTEEMAKSMLNATDEQIEKAKKLIEAQKSEK
jgi:predicted transposase YdaD